MGIPSPTAPNERSSHRTATFFPPTIRPTIGTASCHFPMQIPVENKVSTRNPRFRKENLARIGRDCRFGPGKSRLTRSRETGAVVVCVANKRWGTKGATILESSTRSCRISFSERLSPGLAAQVGQQFPQPGPFGALRPWETHRKERPALQASQDFGGIDSRAEGPWLGELLALWAADHG